MTDTKKKLMFFPVADEVGGRLPYGFAGVGCRYPQEHVRRPGGRNETEWMYPYYQWIQCRRGCGELILGEDGRHLRVPEGYGMLLFPHTPHEYYAVTPSWEVDWIVFSGIGTENFIRNVMGAEHGGVFSVTRPHTISMMTERLYETAISDDPTKYAAASGIVYEILVAIYVSAFRKQGASIADRADRLRPVFRYIDEHYKEPLGLDVLAEVAGVTPQHLCVLFKSLTSRTVTEYVNGVRTERAKTLLLRDRGMKIKDVAAASGFCDVSYFCAVFRRTEGLSPSAFRGRG